MTNNLPKVTVLLPAYNVAPYIQEAINSILTQTFTDFELLIINDGSTDHTEEEVQKITDNRIVYVKNEQNIGLANTLNKGMKLARGEYIARMDGDDISLPERLKVQVDYLDNNPDIGLCSTGLKMFGASDKITTLKPDFEQIKIELIFGSAVNHASSMFRKDVFIGNNLFYDQEYFPAEDYELWTRAVFNCRLINLPDLLYLYRMHGTQVTKMDPRALRKSKLIQKKYLGFALPEIGADSIDAFVEKVIHCNMIDPENVKTIWPIIKSFFEANSNPTFFQKYSFERLVRRTFQNKVFNGIQSCPRSSGFKSYVIIKHLRMTHIAKYFLSDKKSFIND